MKLAAALVVTAIISSVVCDDSDDPTCKVRKFTITVDNMLELYIDGVPILNLPNRNNWKDPDSVNMNCSTKVIAVKGTDDRIKRASILASTDDGYVMTNASWKCTSVYYTGWELVTYDDSNWPAAYITADHQTVSLALLAAIRTDAYWIWTPNYISGPDEDIVVYCRKNLVNKAPPIICPPGYLSITADNSLRLYFDGVEKTNLPNANGWKKVDCIVLPDNMQVIAVQGTDDGVARAGILCSTTDDYVLTNASWKCTKDYYSGWESVTFDDSAWPAAYAMGTNQKSPWEFIPGIRDNACWIWTSKYNRKERVVYCRKTLRGEVRN